jgi:very-short-patch-repair endonuclease
LYGAAIDSAIEFTMAFTRQKRLEQARRLRRAQTPAEGRLWSGLRDRRLQNYKFNRQYPLGPFTVDREVCLVIEVDGVTHSEDREIAYDQGQTAYLKSEGYRVLRILNDDIYRHYDDVMDMILLALEGKLPEG